MFANDPARLMAKSKRAGRMSAGVTALVTLGALLFWSPQHLLRAETTKRWTQSVLDDFEDGTAEKVSLRSDGKVMLAPLLREIYESPSSYLWALAFDSKGNLYTAGGPDAKVFRVTADGTKSTFFETQAIEIHALAVDAEDNVYAATSPEAKIYKIDPSGKQSLFYDPGANYVWDMKFDSKGNLLVATGDNGKIFRVTPAGVGSLFFDTGETHVRSLAIDAQDNLIVGTEPGGLILRVSPNQWFDTSAFSSQKQAAEASGFVLYQTANKEVTSILLGADGSVYAASVGTRTPSAAPPAPPTSPEPAAISVNSGALAGPGEAAQTQSDQPASAPTTMALRVTGGSDIYRIAKDGEPTMVWHSRSDVVYALAFDTDGRVLAATGDHGRLIRLDSDHLYSIVITTNSRQITALATSPKKKLYAATSNIGRVFEIGPELETEGTLKSKPFDAGIFSEWGRLEWKGEVAGGAKLSVSTRSGNLDSPSRHWSDWSTAVTVPDGGAAGSPAARFVQWQAVLQSVAGAESPVLDSVTLYYRPRNIAPVIDEIDATPPNYRFPEKVTSAPSKNITLPPLGGPPRRGPAGSSPQGQTLLPAQGYIGMRWDADDPNDDTLIYKVEIRAEDETTWKLLEEKLEDSYLSWDSTSFADGLYRVRVTASDAPSNAASDVKTASQISEPFLIDNTAPRINDLTATAGQGKIRVKFTGADTATAIRAAEYSLDGGEWQTVPPTSGLFDSRQLSFNFEIDQAAAGERTVAVRIYDSHDNVATAKAVVR